MTRRPFLYVVALAIVMLIAFGCADGQRQAQSASGARGGRQGRGPSGQAFRVRTTPVQKITFQRQIDLSGTLLSFDQVRVSSEVPGVVKELLVELGTEVRAGQELVRIDTRELELALRRAESSLRQTEAQLGILSDGVIPADELIASVRTAAANRDDARAQFARAQELVSKGLLPKAELDTTGTRVKVTEANYQAALENVKALKAMLQDRLAAYELAQKKMADAAVRAPIGGAISDRPIQRGEYIRENTVVATIVQMNPLKLLTAVQEKYADVIKPNLVAEFRVESVPGQVFEGQIAFISPAIDQATRTFPVEILVDNSNRRLKPGFFAKGVILTQRDENVPAVPENAVSSMAGVFSVYVIQDGKAEQRNIRVGDRQGNLIEVVEGLKGDEILAAGNLNELFSGMEVVAEGSRSGPDGQAGPAAGPETVAPPAEAPQQGGRRKGGM